jgi:transcriptional regulator with XRE-family HTH domain
MTAAASIGRMIRWARKRAGMTQQDLASAVQMPQPSIARLERGTVAPRTSTLVAILEATGHVLAVEPRGQDVDREAIRRALRQDVPRRTWDAIGRATMRQRTNPVLILRRLGFFGVPYVLVGELAEIAHGSGAKLRREIEVVYEQTDEARERLGRALEDLEAQTSDGVTHQTVAGRLRLLTETAAGDDYELLARVAERMFVDAGIRVRVAALEDLIRIRRAGRTPDDRAAEAVLVAIGEEAR